jgi:uncharacterized protein YeaO (DUF488 family)
MSIRIVRLGADRLAGEGLRIGTVRRPPRGVRKSEYASKNFYDVWRSLLAPSSELVKKALTTRSEREWQRFVKSYRREMDEGRCHRPVLRELLRERGAQLAPSPAGGRDRP